jgi:hypothetical protein
MLGRPLHPCNSGEWGVGQWWAVVYVVMNLVVIYYNQQMHNYIITVYIITVFLCNLYCYMFQHFHVVIMVFTTNALLSYVRSSNCIC